MPGQWTFLSNHGHVLVGRRNQYEVVGEAHFRHDLEAHVTLGEFVGLVVGPRSAAAPRSAR